MSFMPKSSSKTMSESANENSEIDDICNKILNDPLKRALALKFLAKEKNAIQEYKRKQEEKANNTVLNRMKKLNQHNKCESPVALYRRKALEKLNKPERLTNPIKPNEIKPARSFDKVLKGVVAYVDIWCDGEYRSEGAKVLLKSMGAEVRNKITREVTHIIFRDGSYLTFQKAKILKVHFVSVLWLEACNRTRTKVKEKNYPAIGANLCNTDMSSINQQIEEFDKICKQDIRASYSRSKPSTSKRQTSMGKTFSKESKIIETQAHNKHAKRRLSLNLPQADTDDSDNNLFAASDSDSDCCLIDGQAFKNTKDSSLIDSYLNISFDSSINNSKQNIIENEDMSTDDSNVDSMQLSANKYIENNSANFTASPVKKLKQKLLFDNIAEEDMELTSNFSTVVLSSSSDSNEMQNPVTPTANVRILDCKVINTMKVSNSEQEPVTGKNEVISIESSDESLRKDDSDFMQNPATPTSNVRILDCKVINTMKVSNNEQEPVTGKNEVISIESSDESLRKDDSDFITNNSKSSNDTTPSLEIIVGSTISSDSKDNSSVRGSLNEKSPHSKGTLEESKGSSSTSDLYPLTQKDLFKSVTKRKRRQELLNLFSNEVASTPSKGSSQNRKRSLGSLSSDTMSSLRISSESANSSKNFNKENVESVSQTNRIAKRRYSERIKSQQRFSLEGENILKERNTKLTESSETMSSLRLSVSANSENSKPQNNVADFEPAFPEEPPTKKQRTAKKGFRRLYSSTDPYYETAVWNDTTNNDTGRNRTDICHSQPTYTEMPPIMIQMTKKFFASASKADENNDRNLTETVKNKNPIVHKSQTEPPKKAIDKEQQLKLIEELINGKKDEIGKSDAGKTGVAVRRSVRKLNFDKIIEEKKTAPKLKQIEDVRSKTKDTQPSSSSSRRSTLEFISNSAKKSTHRKRSEVKKMGGIVCTKFQKNEEREFNQMVKKLGELFVEECVTENTTHLVVREPLRTMNMLKAIIRGCWILKKEWLFDSFKRNKWLPEEDYELVEYSPAVKQCRMERYAFSSSYAMDIFENCGPIYVSSSCHPSKAHIQELISLCKGNLVTTCRQSKITVGECVKFNDVISVSVDWVLESIQNNKLRKLKKFSLTE